MRTLMVSLLTAFSLLFCAALSADLQNFDGEFETANWEQQVMAYGVDGSGGGTTSRQEDGGNPGAYREVDGNRVPGSANPANVTHIYSFAKETEYNPATMGAVTALDIVVEARMLAGAVGMVAPAARQNGTLYVGEAVSAEQGAWTTKLFLQLEEASFSEVGAQNARPDFSSSGGTIVFGFVYIVAAAGVEAVESTAGFDNWSIYVVSGNLPDFLINAGLNDAWYYQPTAGQGWFITVFPNFGLVFLAWFTYDTERPDEAVIANLGEAGHRWLTAIGEYAGDTVVLDVELTSGGVFDSEEPAPDQEANYGTITIVFHDCMNATLTYDFPALGLMGEIPITRIVGDNVPLCQALLAELQAQ